MPDYLSPIYTCSIEEIWNALLDASMSATASVDGNDDVPQSQTVQSRIKVRSWYNAVLDTYRSNLWLTLGKPSTTIDREGLKFPSLCQEFMPVTTTTTARHIRSAGRDKGYPAGDPPVLDGTQDEPPCPHCLHRAPSTNIPHGKSCPIPCPPIFLMGRAAPSLVHQYSSWEGCPIPCPPIVLMGRAAPSLAHQYSSWEELPHPLPTNSPHGKSCPIPCPPIFLMGRAAPSLVNDQNRFRLYQQFWQLLNDLGLWDHPTYLMRKEVVTHIDDRQEIMPLCVKHITTLRNRDRTDPNYHDWSKYQAKSIKLGMDQFSPLFSQKAEASMDMVKGHEP
ncbi:hypothetical protein EMCRGX_G015440 [Ephydatia muelleri]